MRAIVKGIAVGGSVVAMVVAGCFVDAGLSDCEKYPGPGCPIGSGGSTGSGGSAGSAGSTGSATTACKPGSALACYSGPSGTKGVGVCKEGSQACKSDGSGYGPCEGEVLPVAAEDCTTATTDENCDGEPACNGGAITG